ncbi:hypothetical protein FOZ61_004666 [Perkinsus olseni]|uniref:Uncharacterized protein n=1 Tax=Perkinsus olseni TaxID=32597 RepID=A0A7J6LJR9_PEROL|nr:hypothetical protein FOL46_007265 [Perkinsus olseni]KAF4659537.1 hypothetical protein FOZ61_004666 [Perkinsus olseni]
MMNFISTWLIPAQLLVITTAQPYGNFVHRSGVYNITYRVDEQGQALFGFASTAPPPPGSPPGTPPRHLGNHFGPHPLSTAGDNTYGFDLSRISVMSWYESIKFQLQEAGDAKADEPLAGIQTGDLTTLTYTADDTLTTNFRNEVIEFKRVPYPLIPGEFEHYGTEDPHLRLSYRVYSTGAVGIQASCDGGSITPRFVFKLTRPDWGMPYNVRSVGLTPPYALTQMVQSDCPTAGVQSTDLLQVTFITKDTIFVTVGERTRALSRVQ